MNRLRKCKYKSILIFILLLCQILSGCTNLVAGNATAPKFVDEEELDKAVSLFSSTRTGVNAKLNFGAGGEFSNNKYLSTYADAFFVASDLSNNLDDVLYFNLLETFNNKNGNITFVYAYTTHKYADGKKRNQHPEIVTVSGDYVMYPEVYEEQELPVSNEVYTVLASYSFAEGDNSYHEYARMATNEEDNIIAKPFYTNSSGYKVGTYGVLLQDKIYVFNADNLKTINNDINHIIELSEAGICLKSGELSKSFDSSAGAFDALYNIQKEFNSFKANDKTLSEGSYDIQIFDFNVYMNRENYYIFFDITATNKGIKATAEDENDIDVFRDGEPVTLDTDDPEKVEIDLPADVKGASSYDFIGTICHARIPDGTKFNVVYEPTKTIGDSNVAYEYTYSLVPEDSIYDKDRRNEKGSIYGESDYYSKYFSYYSYLINEDNSTLFEIDKFYDKLFDSFLRELNMSASELYQYKDNDKSIGLILLLLWLDEKPELRDFVNKYLKSSTNPKAYSGNFKLVTNSDAYRKAYNSSHDNAEKYTINLTGELYLKPQIIDVVDEAKKYGLDIDKKTASDEKEFLSFVFKTSFMHRTFPIYYKDDEYEAFGGATEGLQAELYNGYLNASSFVNVDVSKYSVQFLNDDEAVIYDKSEKGSIIPKVIPLTAFSNIFSDYNILVNGISNYKGTGNGLKFLEEDGALLKVEPVLIGSKIYVYYVFENKVYICDMDKYRLGDADELRNEKSLGKLFGLLENVNNETNKNYVKPASIFSFVGIYTKLMNSMKPIDRKSIEEFIAEGNYAIDTSVLNISAFTASEEYYMLKEDIGNYSMSMNSLDNNTLGTDSYNKLYDNFDNNQLLDSSKQTDNGGFIAVYYSDNKDKLHNANSNLDNSNANRLNIYFTYEGISVFDDDGKCILDNVSYYDVIDVISGKKNLTELTQNELIINNWEQSTAGSEYESVKQAMIEGLHFQYIINIIPVEGSTGIYNINIIGIFNDKYVTIYSYENISYSDATFKALDHTSGDVAINDMSWNSICEYMKTRFSQETVVKTAPAYKPGKTIRFNADDFTIKNGHFTTKEDKTYVVCTNPEVGLYVYETDTTNYYKPAFQRHEIKYTTTYITDRDNNSISKNMAVSDNIVVLDGISCYGIYDNIYNSVEGSILSHSRLYNDDKVNYPYLLMGFDKQGVTYTQNEMLRSKMIPFGIAYNDGGTYYRDFNPVDKNDFVYYLKDAEFDEYGRQKVTDDDGGIIDRDKSSVSDNGNTVSNNDSSDGSNTNGNNNGNKNGNNSNNNSNKNSNNNSNNSNTNGNGNQGAKKPSSMYNETSNVNASTSSNASDKNTNKNTNNSDTNIAVSSNSNNNKSLYDDSNNRDNDDSLSDNGVSDNSISKNGISDNSVSDDSTSDNSLSSDGLSGLNGKVKGMPVWLLLLILLILLIVAYIIYRIRNRKNSGDN